VKKVGGFVILLGLAGVAVFSKPDLQWESAGAAVFGVVLLVISRR
jgi:hypothetical protein